MHRSFVFVGVIALFAPIAVLAFGTSNAQAGDPYTCFRQYASCKSACMSAPDYGTCIAVCQSQYQTCVGS